MIEYCENDDPRTIVERNLYWIESEWNEALNDDTYDAWRDVRMMCFGVLQSMVYVNGMHEEWMAISTIMPIAFEHSMRCIAEGKTK